MTEKVSRTTKKREQTHQLIIKTAITLFLKKRSGNVSLEEIAETADIARRTVYYHFKNKESLILKIVTPIIRDGIEYLDTLKKQNNEIKISDIAALCLTLWERHGSSLNLLYSIDFENYSELKSLHTTYINTYMEVFNKVTDIPESLTNNKTSLAAMIYHCFVPILIKIKNFENMETRFTNCLNAMITGLQ